MPFGWSILPTAESHSSCDIPATILDDIGGKRRTVESVKTLNSSVDGMTPTAQAMLLLQVARDSRSYRPPLTERLHAPYLLNSYAHRTRRDVKREWLSAYYWCHPSARSAAKCLHNQRCDVLVGSAIEVLREPTNERALHDALQVVGDDPIMLRQFIYLANIPESRGY